MSDEDHYDGWAGPGFTTPYVEKEDNDATSAEAPSQALPALP